MSTQRENPEALFEGDNDRAAYVRQMFGEISHRYDLVNRVMTVVDKVASLGGPTGRVVAGGAAVGKEWMQIAVKNAIADEGAAAGIRLERGALPVNDQTGELGVGDAVASAFEDRLASVTRTAQP